MTEREAPRSHSGDSQDMDKGAKTDLALERSQATLQSLLRAAPIGIGFVIARVFQWTNETLQEMTGYANDELVGHSARLLYESEAEFRRVGQVKYAAIAQEGKGSVETRFRRKDGRIIDVLLSSAPLEPGNLASGVVFTALDITARKRAERELRAYSARLEEMVRVRSRELETAQEQLVRRERLAVLGQLAGGVGHELRNPLNVIANAAELLRVALGDADPLVDEYVDLIVSATSRSLKIVTDLLGLARAPKSVREKVSASDLVAWVLERRAPPEGVRLSVEVPPALPLLLVDSEQIGIVLTNVVENAYQAMPSGGALTISARVEQGQLCLSVHDTGYGIPEENLAMLFEPLFTTKARGIGLGLPISKSLVEANGGRIEVESREGHGSTFVLWLPLAERAT